MYLKLQPYIQSSVAPRSNQKLSFRYFGPFQILQRVGKVAYKLALPLEARIHPVVHVSQLKKHILASIQVSADLDMIPSDPSAELLPVAVLDHRWISTGSSPKHQVLIQWEGLPSSRATWEESLDVQRRFPSAPTWGQVGFKGRGNVKTCSMSG